MEPIRSSNKERKPVVSAASQGFVLILLTGDNGEPVVCEPVLLSGHSSAHLSSSV